MGLNMFFFSTLTLSEHGEETSVSVDGMSEAEILAKFNVNFSLSAS
jgi:hypothetical protein